MTMEEKREFRKHKSHSHRSEFGRTHYQIDCPFCGATVKAFTWSIAGGGKKCSCGAMHVRGGTFAPINFDPLTGIKTER